MFTAKWPTASGSNPILGRGWLPHLDAPNFLEKRMELPSQFKPGFRHTPVLLEEVLALMVPGPGKLFVDGTLGGGGHSEAFLRAGAQVIGLDQDDTALRHTGERLASYGEAFRPVHGNFRDLAAILKELSIEKIDGLFLDIGVSSHQIDTPERGFSFQADGPLDMRMDQNGAVTAADLVNAFGLEELIHIFRVYGEEPSAVRIARHLVSARTGRPFQTTGELAAAVESIVPRRGRRHPATQVFQALRIAVNDELGALETILADASFLLNPGARFGIITFHSLEDRLVKKDFHTRSQKTLDRPEWPAPRSNPACIYHLPQRKSITAQAGEISNNPRSRSAHLRVAEKLQEVSHVA